MDFNTLQVQKNWGFWTQFPLSTLLKINSAIGSHIPFANENAFLIKGIDEKTIAV